MTCDNIQIGEPRTESVPLAQFQEKSIVVNDLNNKSIDDDFYDLFTKTPQKSQTTIMDASMLTGIQAGTQSVRSSVNCQPGLFKLSGKSLFKLPNQPSISPGKSRIPLPTNKRSTMTTNQNNSSESLLEPLVHNINDSNSHSFVHHDIVKTEKLSITAELSSDVSANCSRIETKSFHIKDEPLEQSINKMETVCAKSVGPPSLKITSSGILPQQQTKSLSNFSISIGDDEILLLNNSDPGTNEIESFEHPLENMVLMENSIYVKRSPIKFSVAEYDAWEELHDISDDKTVSLTNNVYLPHIVNLNETKHIIDAHLIDERANPFNIDVKAAFLDQLQLHDYLKDLPTCNLVNTVRPIKPKGTIDINNRLFCVEALVGQGSFGHIFR